MKVVGFTVVVEVVLIVVVLVVIIMSITEGHATLNICWTAKYF